MKKHWLTKFKFLNYVKKWFSKFNFGSFFFSFIVPEFKFLKSKFLCILKIKFRNTIWKLKSQRQLWSSWFVPGWLKGRKQPPSTIWKLFQHTAFQPSFLFPGILYVNDMTFLNSYEYIWCQWLVEKLFCICFSNLHSHYLRGL